MEMKVSKPTLTISAKVIAIKTLRTKLEPPRRAKCAPRNPPATLAIASVRPTFQRISPLRPKIRIAPKFVATFTTLAIAEAERKAKPNTATKVRTKKDPVPGPINPS